MRIDPEKDAPVTHTLSRQTAAQTASIESVASSLLLLQTPNGTVAPAYSRKVLDRRIVSTSPRLEADFGGLECNELPRHTACGSDRATGTRKGQMTA